MSSLPSRVGSIIPPSCRRLNQMMVAFFMDDAGPGVCTAELCLPPVGYAGRWLFRPLDDAPVKSYTGYPYPGVCDGEFGLPGAGNAGWSSLTATVAVARPTLQVGHAWPGVCGAGLRVRDAAYTERRLLGAPSLLLHVFSCNIEHACPGVCVTELRLRGVHQIE